jgi:hypothetical protein
VRVLIDGLSTVNPVAFHHTLRIREHVQRAAARLQVTDAWQYEMAAMLSQLGAHDLLSNIPRLETVAQMIARQDEPIDASRSAQPIAMRHPADVGGAMLHAAFAIVRLTARGLSEAEAIAEMRTRPTEFDPAIVAALAWQPPTAVGVAS